MLPVRVAFENGQKSIEIVSTVVSDPRKRSSPDRQSSRIELEPRARGSVQHCSKDTIRDGLGFNMYFNSPRQERSHQWSFVSFVKLTGMRAILKRRVSLSKSLERSWGYFLLDKTLMNNRSRWQCRKEQLHFNVKSRLYCMYESHTHDPMEVLVLYRPRMETYL